MDPERWLKAEALLEELLDLPALERARRLSEACAGELGLRNDVERLLEASSAAGTPAAVSFSGPVGPRSRT